MKIIFLIPPSEGKNNENKFMEEELSFNFEKPLEIASNVTEKDLKCKGKRFKEWLELNRSINLNKTDKSYTEAIFRYFWVMYSAIDYSWINTKWKEFFEENFLIFSWMYGIVKPLDKIWNYKLPIETKWLYQFWWNIIPEKIAELKVDYVVNLLPISYAKLIGLGTPCNRHKKKINTILESKTKIININFLKPDGKKISHGVKKIKGEWIKDICEKLSCHSELDTESIYKAFWWEIVENWDIIDVNIV